MSNLIRVLADIRDKARLRGWSDAELARRAGISPEAFSRIGRTGGARFDTVEKLASVVGHCLKLVPDDEYLNALMTGTLMDLGDLDP